MFTLDDTDRRLLRQLQAVGDGGGDAGLSDLAARCGVTVATASRRLARLESAGVIEGFEAVIDWRALGFSVEVSLRINLDKTRPRAFDDFIEAARDIPEVMDIQTFLGRVDVRLTVLARDMRHYQEIYRDRILALPHINDIEALVLVSDVKNSESLPL